LPKPGWAEHDAEEVWWRGFTEVCTKLLESAVTTWPPYALAALALAFWRPVRTEPLRPAILYGIDTRASREVEELTELRWPAESAGEITQEIAEATGLPAGISVAVGTTDSFADSLSIGVKGPGDVMIIYGSTMSIIAVLPEALPASNLWTNAHLFEGTHNLASGMSTSGSLTDWLKEISGDKPFEELIEEVTEVAPGSEALVVLACFAGERTPISDPDACGVICGLTLSHGRGHLYRALLESTGYGACHLLEAISDAGGETRRFVAVGRGTKGSLWTQVISDITSVSQELPEQTVGASYGDANLAGIARGLVETDADWSSISSTVEPNPENREVYDELYTIYRDLYPVTSPLVHALAGMQTRGEL
jgi:xylulokinase